jgi:DNA-binding PadR family transcriptional regulator
MTMILAVLRDGSRHGYDVAREVERRSDRRISFNDGTLYPILHSLEKEGLIVSAWENPTGERRRRVYALNDSGLLELSRQVAAWQDFASAVNQVLQDPVENS